MNAVAHRVSGWVGAIPAQWRQHLGLLAIVVAAQLILFGEDTLTMVSIWWNSSTFTHCLFILPIIGWLIWQRKAELVPLAPHGFAPGLVVMAAAVLLWTLGQAGGVALFRHAALVLMLQASVLTILGPVVTRAILFPLFYLVFLIPVGEEAVPLLQTITAKLTMMMLALSGIPATIDGVFITTPHGYFEVAEACSGVKFLIAMAAYGVLAANICFKSWARRIPFLLLALIVPILANGVRAFGTIYISKLTSIEFASSFDHIFYGWIFFALVMAIVMLAGWRFFDRKIDDPWLEGLVIGVNQPAPAARGLGAALVALALAALGWQAAVAALGERPMPHAIDLPVVRGWQFATSQPLVVWQPRFDGADHRVQRHYVNAAGEAVDVAVVLFGWQEEGREIVGFGRGAVDPESSWAWTADSAAIGKGRGERILGPGVAREVVSFYVLDGKVTGSATQVKLATLAARLRGGDQAAVAVLVSAEERPGHPARTAISAFLRDLGPVDQLATDLVDRARGD